MAQLLVRNLENEVKAKLQRQAREHGNSMESEVRQILRAAVSGERAARPPLGASLAGRFAGIGLDFELEELRGEAARAAEFKP